MLGINTLLFSKVGVFYMLGDVSLDIHGTNGFMWYPTHEVCTVSNVESQVFTPYNYGSTAGNRTADLCV